MALTPGTRLGVYKILSPLGAGGMGEVYRAHDTKLNRDVAIKVLPEAFASDAERLARFTREAQTLAALNHPNIAAIYGIEEAAVDGPARAGPHSAVDVASGFSRTRALVMELVEGEDLSAHIARGPMSLAEALPMAKQIADALEAAHEQGIVHRDLKPANVKVRADGMVKVLDFGLAKALDPAAASSAEAMNSPTLTAHATQMGMIIGTAAYMAPEQARGKAVDRRADMFGISWGPDGIVFGQGRKGIMRVSPNGGTPDVLVTVKDGEEAHGPQVLPGGQHVMFTLATGTALDRWDKAHVVVQSLRSGERTTLIEGASDAQVVLNWFEELKARVPAGAPAR